MRPETVNGELFAGTIAGGTPQLFPSAPYLAGKAKYPRGFTPERQREVTQATNMNPKNHYHGRAGAVAGIRDTLAASTAPVEHMSSRKGTGGNLHWYANAEPKGTEAGSYTESYGSGSAWISPGQERTPTVIHELGHHVSHLIEQTPHSSYDTPLHQGQEEAFAENYADTHFRDRRGRPTPAPAKSGNGLEWTRDGARGGPYGDFGPAFSKKRDESPVVQAASAARAARTDREMRPIPPGTTNHVFGQERFLDRTESGSRAWNSTTPPRPTWNYVQRGADDPLHDPEQNKLSEKRRQRLEINPHI